MSAQQLLEIASARRGMLPRAVAWHLLCAAVARASERDVSLRPALVFLDPHEGLVLDLSPSPAASEKIDSGYVAPEALRGEEPPDDPRVLVYAAGAFGYHLLTGAPPSSTPDLARAELDVPIGHAVRGALALNPLQRTATLQEMASALQAAHPLPSASIERQIFAAVLECCSRWTDGGAAVELALIATSLEKGREGLPADRIIRWMREFDGALHRQQRRQLDMILALASREASAPSPARAPDPPASVPEDFELPEPFSAFVPPPPPRPARKRRGRWLLWVAPVAAGAAAAYVVVHGIDPLVRFFNVVTASASPEPRAQASPPQQPAANPEQPIVTSPIVLSAPAKAEEEIEPVEPAAPQATRGPAPPRASPPPKLISSWASANEDLVTRAERALREGRAAEAQAAVGRGERALHEGRAAEALAAFNAALEAQSDLAPAVRGLALTYVLEGHEPEAKEQIERYLKIAPGAEDAPRMRDLANSLRDNPKRK